MTHDAKGAEVEMKGNSACRMAKGFTLVESILAIVVIAATALVTAELMNVGLQSYSTVVDRREVLNEARLAINFMTNELQSVGSLTDAQPTNLVSGSGADSIRYSVQGSQLLRITPTATNVLANNVTANTRFDYFTINGQSTSDPAAVRRIHMTVEVASQHGSITLKSNLYLRNNYYVNFRQN